MFVFSLKTFVYFFLTLVSSPPWGHLVGEALNRLPLLLTSYKDKAEFDKARDAVIMISTAFQEQADEEFSKRLSRKNFQVMDRLGKLQAYRRILIESIKNIYCVNSVAAEKADRFHRYANKAEKKSSSSSSYAVEDRVPLFECNIAMGAYSGLCLITANEMLLITRLIPVVGGKKYDLLALSDIDVSLSMVAGSHTWDTISNLSQTSSSVYVSRKGDSHSILFSFKPAIQPIQFKAFIDTLQEVRTEKDGEKRLSSSNGLLSLLEEHDLFVKAALGNET